MAGMRSIKDGRAHPFGIDQDVLRASPVARAGWLRAARRSGRRVTLMAALQAKGGWLVDGLEPGREPSAAEGAMTAAYGRSDAPGGRNATGRLGEAARCTTLPESHLTGGMKSSKAVEQKARGPLTRQLLP